MQATITYLLTEQAQRAQMAATGQPVARKQTVTEDVPADLMGSPYCHVDGAGQIVYDLTQRIFLDEQGEVKPVQSYTSVYPEFEALPQSGTEAIRVRTDQVMAKRVELATAYTEARARRDQEEADKRAALYAKVDAAIEAFFSTPTARATDRGWVTFKDGDHTILSTDASGYSLQIPTEHPRRNELIAEVCRRNASDKTMKDAVEAAKEDEKQEYIDTWIEQHADVTIQRQHRDGLLCRASALKLIADAAFAAVGVPEPAPKVKLCDSNNCPCEDTYVDCLPISVYPRWQTIEDRLPAGSTRRFSRVRRCLSMRDDWEGGGEMAAAPIYTADIEMPQGPFRLTRTIEL